MIQVSSWTERLVYVKTSNTMCLYIYFPYNYISDQGLVLMNNY
jgi:hypothetical protein